MYTKPLHLMLPILIILFLASSCSKRERILLNQDFDKGDWLFVNANYVKNTIQIIDDEEVLKDNSKGLWVLPEGECGHTTCDGFLMLYKNGKLVLEDSYIEISTVYESHDIKENYKNGSQWTIEPIDEEDFNRIWDSLISTNCYPTIYHTQPADKDIIWVYKID